MEQEGTQEQARKREVGEAAHELVDLSDLIEQLEAEKQRDPQAAQQLIQLLEQVLAQFQPDDDPDLYASIQAHLGAVYHDMGIVYHSLTTGDRTVNLQEAIACYQQALGCLTFESAPAGYALVQADLGDAYNELPVGDRSANAGLAITCYQQALRVWNTDTAPLDYATTQANLGTAYRTLPTVDLASNLTRAIHCYQEALRIQTPEAKPQAYATTQASLGVAYTLLPMGDREANVAKAIACFQEALRFLRPETSPREYASVQTSMGNAYRVPPLGYRTANVAKAIACFQEALRFLGPDTAPREYAVTQHNLGNAYRDLPADDGITALVKAIACYQEALRVWTSDADSYHYAMTQTNLGTAYLDVPQGNQEANLAQAIRCYQEALRFFTPGTTPLDYAMTQNNLGAAYSKAPTGDRAANIAQAISCFQEALRFLTPETAPFQCRVINYNLGNLHFVHQEWEAALLTYQAAIDVRERLYRAHLSAESKAAEMAENPALYRNAAFAAAHCGETGEALLILERGKARLLADALRLRIARPANVPAAVWLAFEQAAAAVRATQIEVGAAATLNDGPQPIQTYTSLEQTARAANAALDAAIERVRSFAPDFLHDLNLPDMQALLPDEHALLLAFCITEQGSIGLAVGFREESAQVVEVPAFTQNELRQLLIEADADGRTSGGWLVDYARYLAHPEQSSLATWQATITSTLGQVGKRFLAPILSALPPHVERIILLPSAELFLLPLHAAPLSDNSPLLMCDRYQVSYAPSIEALSDTRTRAMQRVLPDLYAVINPQADPQLAYTSTEGAAIAALFERQHVDEGRVGTRRRVIAEAPAKTFVHFSCHGYYDWKDPRQSGLELADGRLTLDELQQDALDLSSARLVTLSACETGISDVMKGNAEEYVGIPAGFMAAGVPCVISSLWSVPDLSTALLMERFYRNHLNRRMDFTYALREAQLWVRELSIEEVAQYAEQCYQQARQDEQAQLYKQMRYYRSQARQNPALRPFAHPYYWAAFTVNGM
jgi:CHAT domain-containing protein/tetratricopeptide (TPR) repeat protein